MGTPASTSASVVALMRAARREPSWERTWSEILIVLFLKRCVWRVDVKAFAIVVSSSCIRLG